MEPQADSKKQVNSALREHSIPFWAKMVCGLLDNGNFSADSKTKVLSATIFRTYRSFVDNQGAREDPPQQKDVLIGRIKRTLGLDGYKDTSGRGLIFPTRNELEKRLQEVRFRVDEVHWDGSWASDPTLLISSA